MSNLSELIGGGGGGGQVLEATASGALTDGCPVVVNINGTVSKTVRNTQTEATGVLKQPL
jgi:hypothetical protein